MKDVYVRILTDESHVNLEKKINVFLANLYYKEGELVDIKYQTTATTYDNGERITTDCYDTVIVLYKE